MARLAADLALALVWLSRLPLGRWGARLLGPNPAPLGRAAWAFPLVGLILGGLAAAVLALALWLGLPVPVAVVLALAAEIRLSGALHEDGLADYADGCGAATPERALDIMRDSRIGSYGVLALLLTLALRGSALLALAQISVGTAAVGLIVAAMLSRAGMVAALAWMAPARRDGLGRGAGRVDATGLAVALALGLLAALLAGALVAALVCAAAQLWLARHARRRLGGQTGDVLGAIQQIGAAAALVALAAA